MGLEGVVVDGLNLEVGFKLSGVHGEVDEAAPFRSGIGTGERDTGRSNYASEVSAPGGGSHLLG